MLLGIAHSSEKYELILNKSSKNTAVLRRITGAQNNKEFTIRKNNNLTVPEDVVDVTIDKIVMGTIYGKAFEEGIDAGEISDIFDTSDSSLSNNVYTQFISSLERLKKR